MTNQQDILRAMMTQLDEASDKLPEGFYLQFCDHIKKLYTSDKGSQPLLDEYGTMFIRSPTDVRREWVSRGLEPPDWRE